MNLDTSNKSKRPWWMTTYGREPLGDVFSDRLWPEWRRDAGEEDTSDFDFAEADGMNFPAC